jgi:hypothetical protein
MKESGSVTELPKNLKYFSCSVFTHLGHLFVPSLPEGLETLIIEGHSNIIQSFPSTLKHLTLTEYYHPLQHLPEGLESLTTSSNSISEFPSSLKHITLYRFSGMLPRLPDGLISLTIQGDFNGEIEYLPSTLKHLRLLCPFNKRLQFPKSLETLEIGGYNQPLDNLPQGLKRLKLGYNFDHELDNLPDSIEEMHLGSRFDKIIYKLPRNLKEIDFGEAFSQLPPEIPEGTEIITLNRYMKRFRRLPKTIRKIHYRTHLRYTVKTSLVPPEFRELMDAIE